MALEPCPLSGLGRDSLPGGCGAGGFRSESSARAWSGLPEAVLVTLGSELTPDALSAARLACKHWRHSLSLVVRKTTLDIREFTAEEGLAYLRDYCAAFNCVRELVLSVSFRRVPRERIQACIDSHLALLKEFTLERLQLNYDLNSFNERKVRKGGNTRSVQERLERPRCIN